MKAVTKYSWIGLVVVVSSLILLFVLVGPKEVLAATFFAMSADTENAPGYSTKAFSSIVIGDSEADVKSVLGNPFTEVDVEPYQLFLYASHSVSQFDSSGVVAEAMSYTVFGFNEHSELNDVYGQKLVGKSGGGFGNTAVEFMFGDGQNSLGLLDVDIQKLIAGGATPESIRKKFGPDVGVFESKAARWLNYSRSPGSKNYWKRRIGIDRDGKVSEIHNERYFD